MKILFVMEAAFSPYSGGVQKTTYKLGKHFTEHGFEVSYLSITATGHTMVDYGTLYRPTANYGGVTDNYKFILETLRELQPDVVINQYPYNRTFQTALNTSKKELGFKLIGCLRNSLFSFKCNTKEKLNELLNGLPLRLALTPFGIKFVQIYHYLKHRRDLKRIIDYHDRFVLLAPPNQKELEYFVGEYKSHKICSIPNSIPNVFEFEQKDKMMVYVGRLDVSQKRADLLVPVWKELVNELKEWNFVIVGDGPYKGNIDEDIRHLNLPRIETTGRQDPNPYYEKAAIFVMPSAYEGFPNVIMEAQSHSVIPVVFDSYLALSWIVNKDKDAVIVEPFDVRAMSDNIIKLARDNERLQQMASAARLNAERFTIDKVGQIWFSFFEELISDGKKE